MNLTDRWEIRKGPSGNDYMLVEKREYFSKKHKIFLVSETPRYYPNMQTLAKAVARLEGIDAVALESVEAVLARLEAVEQSVLDGSRVT